MPSSPSPAGTPEPEKSQQPRPSAIIPSILTRMGSESPAQGDEPVHPFLGAVPTDAVLFYDPEPFSAHNVPRVAGFRPRMKALASGTSVAAALGGGGEL